MVNGRQPSILQQLGRLIGRPSQASGVSDAHLLNRFVSERDEAAFELIVWRHGPMVYNACVRVLNDTHLAEDAFQAAFLTLARRAETIGKGSSIGSWLHQVAHRIALRLREQAANRLTHEQPLGDLAPCSLATPAEDEAAWKELRPVLDAELQRLPEKYRAVVVLCYLQGRTNEEAAAELGCPKGTVLSRLSRARARLRRRLEQRGVVLGELPFVMLLEHRGAEQLLPGSLVASTVRAVADGKEPQVQAPLPNKLHLQGHVLTAVLVAVTLAALGTGAILALSQSGPTPGKPESGACGHEAEACQHSP